MSQDNTSRKRETLFRSISVNRGGAAGVLLNPALVAEAEGKLQGLRPMVLAEIRTTIGQIRTLAASKAALAEIFNAAHEVRGLAGAYGFHGAGIVAGAIRAYGENQPEGFKPDWGLLQLLAQMLAHTFERPESASPTTLAAICREAVGKVMAREGREPPEGAL